MPHPARAPIARDISHISARARVSASAASRLGARPATPAPLARALRGSTRARGAIVAASASEDDGDWNDEPTVNVPISFFSILNLSPARASPASIEAAYTSVIQRELVEGFSNSCLAARADLVDAAAQVISDPELRAEHESDLKNGRLTPVPASQLGGALALMQEAGEHEAVIEYAPECLAAAKSRVARRDITLSAALAHCELSHNALVATPPRVGEGCELLDIASQILVAEAGRGFSTELQETIDLTLREMAPAYVIELIAMPLEARRERKAGVRALRHILWADPENALNDRDAYVVEVNRHLTASEVVDLFLEAPDSVPADAEEVYQSAMAHIVTGYRERRPSLVVDADEMLAQLEHSAYAAAQEARAQAERLTRAAADAGCQPPPQGAWATPPAAEPVNVERAVCQLLLGRVEDAAYSLGMGQDPSPYPLDPQVERFVREHSPSGDYTEGLCALADRWIADVAFPSFRDSARVETVPSIAQWFDEPDVQRFCERLDAAPALAKTLAAPAPPRAPPRRAPSGSGTDSGAPGTCPVSGRRVPWAPPWEQREEVWGAASAGRASRARSSDTRSPPTRRSAAPRSPGWRFWRTGSTRNPPLILLLAVSARPPCRRPPETSARCWARRRRTWQTARRTWRRARPVCPAARPRLTRAWRSRSCAGGRAPRRRRWAWRTTCGRWSRCSRGPCCSSG